MNCVWHRRTLRTRGGEGRGTDEGVAPPPAGAGRRVCGSARLPRPLVASVDRAFLVSRGRSKLPDGGNGEDQVGTCDLLAPPPPPHLRPSSRFCARLQCRECVGPVQRGARPPGGGRASERVAARARFRAAAAGANAVFKAGVRRRRSRRGAPPQPAACGLPRSTSLPSLRRSPRSARATPRLPVAYVSCARAVCVVSPTPRAARSVRPPPAAPAPPLNAPTNQPTTTLPTRRARPLSLVPSTQRACTRGRWCCA